MRFSDGQGGDAARGGGAGGGDRSGGGLGSRSASPGSDERARAGGAGGDARGPGSGRSGDDGDGARRPGGFRVRSESEGKERPADSPKRNRAVAGDGRGARGGEEPGEVTELTELLRQMIEEDASDLHLTPGVPPQVRIDGTLEPMPYKKLDSKQTRSLLYSVMTDDQRAKMEEHLEVDFSFGIKNLARFRANVFMQRGVVAGALRFIPWRIPSFGELGLPDILADIANEPRGLVLVTGPTGSGKSTTLASMVDLINETKRHHVITIEDPIEYLHQHKQCIVNQRELNADTRSFAAAMRSALREDPDVVLIGEMRDLESTELALKLAETGHLTLATLHTNSAVQTINRVIDIFPSGQQSQIRTQLSFVLVAAISQTLLPAAKGSGRVLAQEILVPNAAIRNLIREDKIHQVVSAMQSGQAESGMKTLNQDLARLVKERKITREVALNAASDRTELMSALERTPSRPRGGEDRRSRRRLSSLGS